MLGSDHLVLSEQTLPAAAEWTTGQTGWIFLRLAEGEGMALGNGSTHLVGLGDVVFWTPARACRLRASQLGPIRFQYFGLEADLLGGVLSLWERQHLEALRQRVILRHYPRDTPVARQFADLCAEARPARLSQRCQMLQLVAPVLAAHLPETTATAVVVPTAQTRFEKLFQQLPESALIRLSPGELAKRCGCSVRHFRRLYRARFGRSLKLRQTELRLLKACELLRDTDIKIIEVALEAGFQHVGLFTNRFKCRFGVTPSVWRRQQRRRAARR